MRSVLVENMTADYKTRLQATLTDEGGRFHFGSVGKGTHYLRFRSRAFDDYLVPVIITSDGAKDFKVALTPSD
jgi:hypothetical protein